MKSNNEMAMLRIKELKTIIDKLDSFLLNQLCMTRRLDDENFGKVKAYTEVKEELDKLRKEYNYAIDSK